MEDQPTQQPSKESPFSLGKSGLHISAPIGIGTWAWGDTRLWNYKEGDEENIYKAFCKVLESGINFFDTAEIYGNGKSEEILGRCIQRRDKELQDQGKEKTDVIVASKFIPLPWRLTHSSFRGALNGSIARLGRKIDLYQVHGPAFSVRRVEVWAEAMITAVKDGLIKSVGVSNYNADQVKRTHTLLAKQGIQLATNQVEFSLLRNNPEHNLLADTCKELGVTIIAYSPLGMGRLTGKYNKSTPPPNDRKFGKIDIEELEKINNLLKEIGDAHEGKTCAQVALNWVICKGAVPIVGVKNERQVEENVGAIGWRLTEEEVQRLDKVSKFVPPGFWQE